MNWQQQAPPASSGAPGRVILLEAEPGLSRRAVMRQWLDEAQADGATTWLLSCDFEEGGVWAGVSDLLQDLLPRIEESAPDLVLGHGYELTMALPHLSGRIPVRHPLTESSPVKEKVRNYPIDRAYRVVHGLINLLAEYRLRLGGGPWVIACDHFDAAGSIATRFFTELMRRRGRQLQLTLLIAAAPSEGEALLGRFESEHVGPAVRLDLPRDAPAPFDAEEAARLAQELEDGVGDQLTAVAARLPQLIRYNLMAGRDERALRWQAMALGLNNHFGFYEDALRYSEPVAARLDLLCGDDEAVRWNLVGNLFGCYVAVGDSARAYQVVLDEALSKLKNLGERVKVYYVMGMLYARYLPALDFDKASSYLERGLRDIPLTDLPPEERYFYTAFMMNGLALVRHRQKRLEEAVELCRSASALLDEHLSPDRHRLHRSVLQYNIAQVYTFTGRFDDAISYYTAAMEMDPNYSEYYNERGSVYLKRGNLDEALRDFLKAVELSPPYPEVLTNLGQCHQLMGGLEEAVEAYSVSLDLLPTQGLALLGRAQAFEALGRLHDALADYSSSLAADPNQPLVLSNRAVLYYETGDIPRALDDLNRAVTLSPRTADLFQNRAVALIDLGRFEEAASDLRTYLRLSPEAEDRGEVEDKLAALQARAIPA
jgi:tetratricopeptide (TPR) repeat protein